VAVLLSFSLVLNGTASPLQEPLLQAWVTFDPSTPASAIRDAVEAAGGRVLAMTPERRVLVAIEDIETLLHSAAPVRTIERMQPPVTTDATPLGIKPGMGERPPSEEELREIEAAIERVERVAPNDLSRERALLDGTEGLPSSVDNSLSIHFPPIRNQGGANSCTTWAAAYYYNTFLQATDAGVNVSTGDNAWINSPGFIYPLINGGVDNGANLSAVMLKLNSIGSCSWAVMPYSASNVTGWPTEAAWVDALSRRTAASASIGSLYTSWSVDKTLALKQLLANGQIATTRTDVYQNWYSNYPSNTTGINNGVLFANSGSLVGGHALTIVGYDDNKTYFDGTTTKQGAFLLANSWGSSWGATNSAGTSRGFMWVAYDLFAQGRGIFGIAYYNTDLEDYRPALYAVSGLNHAQRGYVIFRGGVGSGPMVNWLAQAPISYAGGTSLPVDDSRRIAIDLTGGLTAMEGMPSAPLFTSLSVSAMSGYSGTISSTDFYCDLDGDGDYTVLASADPTVTVTPASTGYATVDLQLSRLVAAPDEPFIVSGPSSSALSPTSKQYTLSNDGQMPLQWTASCGASWIDILPSSGKIAAGESALVAVSLNQSVNTLGNGEHAATVSFVNGETDVVTREVSLAITTPYLVSVQQMDDPVTNSAQVRYTLNFSGAIDSLSTDDLDLLTTGTLAQAFISDVQGSGSDWQVTVDTGTGDGSLWLALKDSISRNSIVPPGDDVEAAMANAAYVVDKTAPEAPRVETLTGYCRTSSVPVAWTAASDGDWGSGVAGYRLRVGTTPGGAELLEEGVIGTTHAVPVGEGQTIYASVSALDAAGNEGPASSTGPAVADFTAPVSQIVTLVPAAPGASSVNITYNASDATSGVAAVKLYYRKQGDILFNELPRALPDSPATIAVDRLGGPGQYSFYTVAIDSAGNEEEHPQVPDATVQYRPTTAVRKWDAYR